MECKKCSEGLLVYIEEYFCGVAETWACDSCDASVVVPISIERHFDWIDWSCADDKQEQS